MSDLSPAGDYEERRKFIEQVTGYVRCRKPDCWRKVPPNVAYCCRACAEGAKRGYEVGPFDPAAPDSHWLLTHSGGCERRSAERGQCRDIFEAERLTQSGAP